MANIDIKGFTNEVIEEAERQLKKSENTEYTKGFTNGTKMVLDIFKKYMQK